MSRTTSRKGDLRNTLPKARTEEIVIQEFGDETLVYDIGTDKAHHLNETVSMVFKNCDGRTSYADLSDTLKDKLEIDIEDDFIWLALSELEKANLLENTESSSSATGISRRDVLVRYGSIAAAFPIVMSLVAPPAVQAQSCGGVGTPCMDPADCCPALICEGTCN
jgi:hypothetical protein